MEIKIGQLSKIKNGDIKVVYFVNNTRQMFYTSIERLSLCKEDVDFDFQNYIERELAKKYELVAKDNTGKTSDQLSTIMVSSVKEVAV